MTPDEDIDDSMAANPEEPREDLPRICERCRQPAGVLHSIGSDQRRLYCGKCQGDHNRESVENIAAAIRAKGIPAS